MPTEPLTHLDRELRKDPEYEAALQELAPHEEIARQLIAFRVEHGLSQTEFRAALGRFAAGDRTARARRAGAAPGDAPSCRECSGR